MFLRRLNQYEIIGLPLCSQHTAFGFKKIKENFPEKLLSLAAKMDRWEKCSYNISLKLGISGELINLSLRL